MKVKEKRSNSIDQSSDLIKTDGAIQKNQAKKKKNKKNFEVHVPRIIVRNLNFKVKEEQLKKAFEKCGSAINNISVVSRNGISKGFGFVTFDKLEDAQKAIQTMNGQKLLGRPMAVDWSLPKNVYEKMQTKESSPPVRNDSYGIQSKSTSSKAKEEQELPPPSEEDLEEEDEGEEEDDDDDDEDDGDDDDELDEEESSKTRTTESSRDVREHRTLFIRNVPFDATEEELSNLLSSNGQHPIRSCRLVIDPISKHPRGSAFVQYAATADAEACLKSSFTLRGQELQTDMALGRGELVKAKELRDQ
ncbi:unnamed protein product, partial [Adineta ricciae]